MHLSSDAVRCRVSQCGWNPICRPARERGYVKIRWRTN